MARSAIRRLRRAWPFLASAAAVGAPFLLYLAFEGALGDALRDLTVSGFFANRILSKPFPDLVESWTPAGLLEALSSEGPLFHVPPVLYLAALALAAMKLRWPVRPVQVSSRRSRQRGALLLLAALLGVLLFLQVLPRSDTGHLAKAYMPAHVLGVIVPLELVRAARRSTSDGRRGRAAFGFAAVVLVALLPLWNFIALGLLSRRSGPYMIVNREQYETIAMPHGELVFLRANAPGLRRIFARIAPYAGREGEMLVAFPGGAMINFLFDLRNPLRYDLLRPGEMAGDDIADLTPNHPAVLEEIRARLEETRPRFLLKSGEETNAELQELIEDFAGRNGYRRIKGAYLTLYERF